MSKRRILVLDDDEAVLDYLQARLGAHYDLILSNVPGNALALAREHRPDLILCDVDMPDQDGGDISRALFDAADLRHIPMLFLTALATPRDLEHASGQLGGRPAISKGAPVDALRRRIESLIGG